MDEAHFKSDCGHVYAKECYPVDQILPLLGSGKRPVILDGDMVSVGSMRLLCFKEHGVACVSPNCNLVGSFFRKERHLREARYHLNLYAIADDGREVLMTVDHITPRSHGGISTLNNLQTMCFSHNVKKGDGGFSKLQQKQSSQGKGHKGRHALGMSVVHYLVYRRPGEVLTFKQAYEGACTLDPRFLNGGYDEVLFTSSWMRKRVEVDDEAGTVKGIRPVPKPLSNSSVTVYPADLYDVLLEEEAQDVLNKGMLFMGFPTIPLMKNKSFKSATLFGHKKRLIGCGRWVKVNASKARRDFGVRTVRTNRGYLWLACDEIPPACLKDDGPFKACDG